MQIYHYKLPFRQFLLLSLLIGLSFTLARLLQHVTGLDGVTAAVLDALIWATIPAKLLQKINISRFLMLDGVYVGAFIALDHHIMGIFFSFLTCIGASLVYLSTNRILTGLGGRLGMQAFISCIIIYGLSLCLPA